MFNLFGQDHPLCASSLNSHRNVGAYGGSCRGCPGLQPPSSQEEGRGPQNSGRHGPHGARARAGPGGHRAGPVLTELIRSVWLETRVKTEGLW